MSGPTTAIYVADPITVLLAASAISAGGGGIADGSEKSVAHQMKKMKLSQKEMDKATDKLREELSFVIANTRDSFDPVGNAATEVWGCDLGSNWVYGSFHCMIQPSIELRACMRTQEMNSINKFGRDNYDRAAQERSNL